MNFLNRSNVEIEQGLIRLVGQERKLLHLILLHVKEIEVRKIYLEKGRSSLYEYLVKDLGYASFCAQRRIEGAKLLTDVPALAEKIEIGKINLSQICEVARAVKQKEFETSKLAKGTNEIAPKISTEEKFTLFNAIENKSIAESQAILSQTLDLELKEREVKRFQGNGSVRLEVTLSRQQYEKKFLECRDRASHSLLRDANLETPQVIEFLEDYFLESIAAPATRSVKRDAPLKSLTPGLRNEIRQRDQACQYRDPVTDQICGSRFLLEIDHRVPQWAKGGHDVDNLTLLCSGHNKLKYRQQSGVKVQAQ